MTNYTSREVYDFISRQTSDPIVEWKTCKVSGQPFPIYQSDVEFYDKISPTFNGKKFAIPTPTLCPEERERRRMAWRNEGSLYRRRCDKTGKSIIAVYPEHSSYTVYDWKFRYTDQRNPMDYGKDFDFNKSFFQNFTEMSLRIPKKSLHIKASMENCDYCNYGTNSTSCYLVTGALRAENCFYSYCPTRSTYDIDGVMNISCQYTYQCVRCIGCFQCQYTDHSEMCTYSAFLSFCKNCNYCLGCVNLHSAKYCILNKQYTKEEYEQLSKTILGNRESLATFEKEFEKLIFSLPRVHLHTVGAEDCYSNYVNNGKNETFCYLSLEGKDNRYCNSSGANEYPLYDTFMVGPGGYVLEVCGGSGFREAFILSGETMCNDCYYCQQIISCQNCFGCEGLKHKQYCILNKQYTKEEYEILVPKIIEKMKADGERGEFFPVENSTFGYNETLAQRFYPMTKEEALARNYHWQETDYQVNIPEGLEHIQGKDLPKTIAEVSDEILNKIILCEITGKPYRIIKQELAFYRQQNIPLPTKHQDQRKAELLQKVMPKEFHLRNCDKCGKQMVSVYASSYPGKVYCEECYQKEVYG